MSLDRLPVNVFDVVLVVVLALGLFRGRRRGMSEESISLAAWFVVVFGCAALYQPVSSLLGQITSVFSTLSLYIMAYVAVGMLIGACFVLIRRVLGGKLLGSDVFGRAEYYLGMGSGIVRYACILIAAMALLNARYFPPAEVRAMEKFQNDEYGSSYFPTLHSVQAAVFERSLTGPWIRDNLSFLLIKRTEPQDKRFHQKELNLP